jgi:hypothetical protein
MTPTPSSPSPIDQISELPEEAIYERLSSGAAARAKLLRQSPTGLPPMFYFYLGELVKDPKGDGSQMRLTGCQFRQAKSGPKAGRWVIPIKGTKRSVLISNEECREYEATLASAGSHALPPGAGR